MSNSCHNNGTIITKKVEAIVLSTIEAAIEAEIMAIKVKMVAVITMATKTLVIITISPKDPATEM